MNEVEGSVWVIIRRSLKTFAGLFYWCLTGLLESYDLGGKCMSMDKGCSQNNVIVGTVQVTYLNYYYFLIVSIVVKCHQHVIVTNKSSNKYLGVSYWFGFPFSSLIPMQDGM